MEYCKKKIIELIEKSTNEELLEIIYRIAKKILS